MFGKSGPQLVGFDPYGRFIFQPFFNLFRIYVKNHKLSVFIPLKDRNGKPIATIDGNTWTIFNDEDYEFNNDDSAFEVVSKGEREVFFQIELSGGVAHLSGYIYQEKNKGICFTENMANRAGSMFIINPKTTDDMFPSQVADRLFKYPRARYSKIEGIRQD
jgi:hypothetical protein